MKAREATKAVEMTGDGSRMENRARSEDWQELSAIPVFHRLPPPLESSQMLRAFHIPTATAAALMLIYHRGHFYRGEIGDISNEA
jgi:hypothetical protein